MHQRLTVPAIETKLKNIFIFLTQSRKLTSSVLKSRDETDHLRGRMFGDWMTVHGFCHGLQLLLFRRAVGFHILSGAVLARFVPHRLSR